MRCPKCKSKMKERIWCNKDAYFWCPKCYNIVTKKGREEKGKND